MPDLTIPTQPKCTLKTIKMVQNTEEIWAQNCLKSRQISWRPSETTCWFRTRLIKTLLILNKETTRRTLASIFNESLLWGFGSKEVSKIVLWRGRTSRSRLGSKFYRYDISTNGRKPLGMTNFSRHKICINYFCLTNLFVLLLIIVIDSK